MPTRRGSLATTTQPPAAGAAAAAAGPAPQGGVVAESAMRCAPPNESMYDIANLGRESFESADDDDAPVKVLSRAFDVAATAPPPAAAAAGEDDESFGVFCRLRPLGRGETGGLLQVLEGDKTVRAEVKTAGFKQHVTRAKDFSFTHVFKADAGQVDVYERTTAPLVDALFRGRSSLLFTYGVTNAGKSYTMMGGSSEDRAGILPRALGAILERARATKDCVVLSFIEIYNENVFDLMDKAGGPAAWGNHHHVKAGGRRALRLKDVGNNRVEVNNLSSVRVSTIAQGLALARAAEAQRKTSSTGLNATSSRSHSICQLELRPANEQPHHHQRHHHHRRPISSTLMHQQRPPKAQLMLVDLAGSERIDRTGASGHQQKEANHINQSVSRLMNCLRVLREKQSSSIQSSVVPWRESKLTHLFQYLLCPGYAQIPGGGGGGVGGQCAPPAKVSMIVNVSPCVEDHSESLFVMANAASAKAVTIKHSHSSSLSTGNDDDRRLHHATQQQQYDNNGRRITNKRPAEKQHAPDKPRREESAKNDSVAEGGVRRGSSTATVSSSVAAAEKEIESLRNALAAALDRVGEVEAEVRNECAEEMFRTIGQIKKEYERRLRARSTTFGIGGRATMQRLSEDEPQQEEDNDSVSSNEAKRRRKNDAFADRLCQSVRKEVARKDLETHIEDLEMRFYEAEAELERVRAESARQIQDLEAKIAKCSDQDADYAQAVDDDKVDQGPALLEEPMDEDLDECGSEDDDDDERRRTNGDREGGIVEKQLRAEIAEMRAEIERLKDSKSATEEIAQSHAKIIDNLQSKVSTLEAEKAALIELKDQAIDQVVELRAQLSSKNLAKKEEEQLIYDEQPPPPPPPRRASRSPLKENSPIVSTHSRVKDVAQTFDARARKLKDERLARQRATQKTTTTSPVAARTRGLFKNSK